ncbi:MAG: hypothetical protein R2847_01390 [Bacteroidia bacterium]
MTKEIKKKVTPPKKSPKQEDKDWLSRLEDYISQHERVFLFVTLALTLLLSFLMFDVKMSEGNDDSDYIEGAFKFSRDASSYYNTKAPLYPMLLSVPVTIWGINVPLLKSFQYCLILASAICTLSGIQKNSAIYYFIWCIALHCN